MICFFEKNPAFYYGLLLFLSIEFALHPSGWLLFPCSLIFFTTRSSKKIAISALWMLCGFGYTLSLYQVPDLPPKGIYGVAHVAIHNYAIKKKRFGKVLLFKGVLKHFIPDQEPPYPFQPKCAPVSFQVRNLSELDNFSSGECFVPCHLKMGAGRKYLLKILPRKPKKFIGSDNHFAALRFKAKQKVNAFLQSLYPSKSVGQFLAGLMTGEFCDGQLNQQFNRFGLSHLLAISGFHFSVIASILSLFIRRLFSPVKAAIVIIALLTAYFIFLGGAPSILRAWIAVAILFGTVISERSSNGINALGVALILALIVDPLYCDHLGFQFSFLMTLTLLLLSKPSGLAMQQIFPKRQGDELKEMTLLSKHALLILNIFRPILALNISLSLAALPLTLFYFQQFPLLSLVYNLFFPFLVTISLFLLLLGLLLFPLAPIANLCHSINNDWTAFILKIACRESSSFDIQIKLEPFSAAFLIIFYTLFFIGAIFWHEKTRDRNLGFLENLA